MAASVVLSLWMIGLVPITHCVGGNVHHESRRNFRDVTSQNGASVASADDGSLTSRIRHFLDGVRELQGLESLDLVQARVGNIHTFVSNSLRETSDFLEELTAMATVADPEATSLVQVIQTLGYFLGQDMQVNESRRLTIGGITFFVSTFRADTFKGLHFSQDAGQCAITIPNTATFPPGVTNVIVVSYSVADVLPIMPLMGNASLGSDLLTTSFLGHDGGELALTLRDHVLLEMTVDVTDLDGKEPLCTFLETDGDGGSGTWSSSGCETVYPVENNEGKVHCHCSHLSTFGIILADEVIEPRIGVAAWIGCSLTILFCVLTALVFIGYRMMQSIRCYIRFSFLTALALAEMLYLCITYTEGRAICTMVAAGVHFFATAAFAWLLSYALFLGNELSGEVEASLQIAHYTFIGWAIPFVVVLITFIWRYESYVDDNYCWISQSEYNLKYAYIIPIGILILMTICVLVYDVIVYMKKKNPKKRIALKISRSGLRSCCVLLPIMAAVWIIADAVVLDNSLWLQVLLSLLNGLLGVSVFLIMFVFNEEILQKRKVARNKNKKNKISRTPAQHSPDMEGRKSIRTNLVLSAFAGDSNGATPYTERATHSLGGAPQRTSSPEDEAVAGSSGTMKTNSEDVKDEPTGRSSRLSMVVARQEFFSGPTATATVSGTGAADSETEQEHAM